MTYLLMECDLADLDLWICGKFSQSNNSNFIILHIPACKLAPQHAILGIFSFFIKIANGKAIIICLHLKAS